MIPQNAMQHNHDGPGPKEEKSPIPIQYLQITCPCDSCRRKVLLSCPYCHKGALRCDQHHFILHCSHCMNTLREINCTCGFIIRPAYILERQKKLCSLQQMTDPSNYVALAVAIGAVSFFVALFALL